MRLHDYCCCAGLGADGYASVFGASAIHGFDHEPQPDYPYGFTQADVMRMLEDGLPDADARHFSFPCQIHTTAGHLRDAQGGKSKYDDLLTPGLAILRDRYNDTPWVVENVDDRSGHVRRIMSPRDGGCDHSKLPIGPKGKPKPVGIYHVMGDKIPDGGATAVNEEEGRKAMGSHRSLPWDKLKEGFPPSYTAWVAADLLVDLRRREVVSDLLDVWTHGGAA